MNKVQGLIYCQLRWTQDLQEHRLVTSHAGCKPAQDRKLGSDHRFQQGAPTLESSMASHGQRHDDGPRTNSANTVLLRSKTGRPDDDGRKKRNTAAIDLARSAPALMLNAPASRAGLLHCARGQDAMNSPPNNRKDETGRTRAFNPPGPAASETDYPRRPLACAVNVLTGGGTTLYDLGL